VVDNRAGAADDCNRHRREIAARWVYAAVSVAGHFVRARALQEPAFDVKRDIAPVALVATQPFVTAVNAGVPAKSVAELIQLAKKEPGRSATVPRVGGASHLGTAMFRALAGIDIVHVPYKAPGGRHGLIATRSRC